MKKKTAFLFPGQGSQMVGMGLDFHREFDFVREIFDMADEICKMHVSRHCFQGPMETLTETVNLQPSITAVNLALFAALAKEGAVADLAAGHSLGEYCALSAANVLTPEDTIRTVFCRGRLMHRESLKKKGAMYAIVGLPIERVRELADRVRREGGVVAVANHNTETQIVITGEPEAVAETARSAKEQGARQVALKVSGAWHSPLMEGAQEEFAEHLLSVDFREPEAEILFNVTADTETDPEEIRSVMSRQLCSPVLWYDIMKKMMEKEVEIFVEVGPGKVLQGLLRKTLPRDYPCRIFGIGDLKGYEIFLQG